MANKKYKLSDGNSWATDGIFDFGQNKTQRQINSDLNGAITSVENNLQNKSMSYVEGADFPTGGTQQVAVTAQKSGNIGNISMLGNNNTVSITSSKWHTFLQLAVGNRPASETYGYCFYIVNGINSSRLCRIKTDGSVQTYFATSEGSSATQISLAITYIIGG